jgi:hypothetical protein
MRSIDSLDTPLSKEVIKKDAKQQVENGYHARRDGVVESIEDFRRTIGSFGYNLRYGTYSISSSCQ